MLQSMFLYLGSLDLWSVFLWFCCWSECLVLCCSNIIVVFLFLTRQKLYVDYDFLRLRFFHYANRELSFNIVHEQWPRGRGKYMRCMATSCSLWVQSKQWNLSYFFLKQRIVGRKWYKSVNFFITILFTSMITF